MSDVQNIANDIHDVDDDCFDFTFQHFKSPPPNMQKMHGYSNIGERFYGTHDWNSKGRKNVIAGLCGK